MLNGKPMSYWRRQAKELVVSQLLAAANLDVGMLPCKLARERLMALAMAEDAELVEEFQKGRSQWVAKAYRLLSRITASRA